MKETTVVIQFGVVNEKNTRRKRQLFSNVFGVCVVNVVAILFWEHTKETTVVIEFSVVDVLGIPILKVQEGNDTCYPVWCGRQQKHKKETTVGVQFGVVNVSVFLKVHPLGTCFDWMRYTYRF